MMTQLVIGGIALPETKKGYQIRRVPRDKTARMADNSLTVEVGGTITTIDYQYDYFIDGKLMGALLAALYKGAEVTAQYLDPRKIGLQSGLFICTAAPNPQYAFSRGGRAFWHDTAFTLESKGAI